MGSQNGDKLAVLIDADNAQASIVQELFAEISRYGTASIRRAYGDWTTSNLKSWKEILHSMAIQPIQQFRYTTGKNATDSSLIIDAMDLLHSGNLDGFCLISSDSDFTRLATRIRENGLVVYGFGENKTPQPFVVACDKFVYTEILKPEKVSITDKSKTGLKNKEIQEKTKALELLEPSIRAAVFACARDDGWASLAAVGSMLVKNSPSFDSRNYGYPKLGELVRNQSYLEIKDAPSGDSAGPVHISIRIKESGRNHE